MLPRASTGHQVGSLPRVPLVTSLLLLSERLMSLTLYCCVRGFLPSGLSGVTSTGSGGAPRGVSSTSAAGSCPSHQRKVGFLPPALVGHNVGSLPRVQPGLPLSPLFRGFIFLPFLRVLMWFYPSSLRNPKQTSEAYFAAHFMPVVCGLPAPFKHVFDCLTGAARLSICISRMPSYFRSSTNVEFLFG